MMQEPSCRGLNPAPDSGAGQVLSQRISERRWASSGVNNQWRAKRAEQRHGGIVVRIHDVISCSWKAIEGSTVKAGEIGRPAIGANEAVSSAR